MSLSSVLRSRLRHSSSLVEIDGSLADLSPALAGRSDAAVLVAQGTAPPGTVASELHRLGFAAHLLDDRTDRMYRLGPSAGPPVPDAAGPVLGLPRARSVAPLVLAHSSHLGGAERSLLQLVDELLVDHLSPCTVVVPGKGPLAGRLRELGASVIPARYPWWCTLDDAVRGPRFDRKFLAAERWVATALMREIARTGPDLIMTWTMAIPWGARAAALAGLPHVWALREYGELDHGLRFVAPLPAVLDDIASSSDVVLFATLHQRSTLYPHRPPPGPVIWGHVPDPQPALGEGPLPWRRPGALRLALFATLQRRKGQDDAIAALAGLTARGHDAELLLAGPSDPDVLQSFRLRARDLGVDDRVVFSGPLSPPWAAMSSADVVLVCSRSEAFGRSCVEAMLLERAIVYPAVGGPADYGVDGGTGLAYEPGDVAGLVERVATLVADPDLRRRLGTAARRRALDLFSSASYGGAAHAALRSVVEGPRRGEPSPACLDERLGLARSRRSLPGRLADGLRTWWAS